MKYIFLLILSLEFLFPQDTTATITRDAWIQQARESVGDTTVTDANPRSGNDESSGVDAFQTTSREVKIFGDHTIPAGAIYEDNIRIIGGNLTIDGTLKSHATVIGGNVIIHSGAVVDGDILALGGSVERAKGAVINGKIIETNLTEGLVYRETNARSDSLRNWDFSYAYDDDSECGDACGFHHPSNWIHPKSDWLIYNRNEGFILTPINAQWDQDGESSFILNLTAGYRQADHSLVGQLTFQKTFFSQRNLHLFAGLFNQSRSDDRYRIAELENTLAAFFGRQDFLDRWNEQGWRAGIGINLGGLRTAVSLNSVNRDTLNVLDIWSLFNHNRSLRPALSFTPYSANYFLISADFKTARYRLLHSGIAAHVEAELFQDGISTTDLLNTDITTLDSRILATLITNWEFTPGILLRGRFLVGTTNGSLPAFRYFGVGGLGSVSAHPYKQQQGDEMVQGSLALIFKSEFLDWDKFFSLYIETGHAWLDAAEDYAQLDFSAYSNNLIRSAGIAVGNADGDDVDFMVNIAKSLDEPSVYETTFRLALNF